MAETFSRETGSTNGDGNFFSVAMTIPFLAVVKKNETIQPLMPTDVNPWFTAANACSICPSLPDGENVVSENAYLSDIRKGLTK